MKHNGLNFVRNFLVVAVVSITLIVIAIFFNFHIKTQKLTQDILLQQGRSLFSELIMTRRWISEHGGVFVKVKPGVDPNPFLTTLPNLKVNITDEDGVQYTMRNPGLVVQGISKLSEESGRFRFHVASLKPVNPSTSSPDSFERKALEDFEKGVKEAFVIEQTEKGAEYRYMAPLIFEKKCTKCHISKENQIGDIRGGISVSIPMTAINEKLKDNKTYIFTSAGLVLTMLFLFLFLLSNKFMKKLDEAQDKLIEMATTDGLTKLFNRKVALEKFEEQISQHGRFKKPLSCLMIDIDHFKSINDTYGHQAGDAFLQMTAGVLKKYSRKYDTVCRYGGEEFIIILPETDLDTAYLVADKMRERVMVESLGFADHIIKATISVGAAQMSEYQEEAVDAIISRADNALYAAKEQGRNRVVADEKS